MVSVHCSPFALHLTSQLTPLKRSPLSSCSLICHGQICMGWELLLQGSPAPALLAADNTLHNIQGGSAALEQLHPMKETGKVAVQAGNPEGNSDTRTWHAIHHSFRFSSQMPPCSCRACELFAEEHLSQVYIMIVALSWSPSITTGA